MESLRYDAVPIKATITAEGYLRDSPVIGRSGVQEYRQANGSIRREYRPPEVVFDAQALAGVAGIPIIDRHVGLMNSANVRQHAIGTVLSSGRQDGTNMVADIVVHDPTPITKHGRKELSLAYAVSTDETPGMTPEGLPYDARVIAITRYDHLAIVEKGRAGVARLRLDHDDAVSTEFAEKIETTEEPAPKRKEITMTEPSAHPVNAKTVIIRVDGIEYPALPEVERALNRVNADLADAKRRADSAEAERDALKTAAEKHQAEVAQVRADAAGIVRARIELENVAKSHGVEVRIDASDRAIREAVIRKLQGENTVKFDDKSDEYIGFAFDHAVAEAVKAKAVSEKNRVAVNGAGPARMDAINGKPVISSAAAARDRMLGRASVAR